jgi:hypothetical protein
MLPSFVKLGGMGLPYPVADRKIVNFFPEAKLEVIQFFCSIQSKNIYYLLNPIPV